MNLPSRTYMLQKADEAERLIEDVRHEPGASKKLLRLVAWMVIVLVRDKFN